MRERVAEGHANPTGLFDLKHDRGGMVDIEFTVQFLVLLHSAAHAELTSTREISRCYAWLANSG